MLKANANIIPDVFDDTYLNMQLVIPRNGDGTDFAKVTNGLRDKDGLSIGRDNNNPILDTRMYEIEYKYGHKYLLAANAIAEKMFVQVNREGNWHVLLQEIVYLRYDGTQIKEKDVFIPMRTGKSVAERRQRGLKSSSNVRTGAQHGCPSRI